MSYPAIKVNAGKKLVLIDRWLIVILASFSLFAIVSWGKLADLIWDTGHEVEIPVRLLAGEILYRDVETYYGPLAYYINAIALASFGQHLEVFYAIGLFLALIATLLVYALAKRLTNPFWAMLCTLCVIIYCAFSPGGLLNFVVPYSYGAVYGLVLCLFAFTQIDRYAQTGRVKWLIAAAIASGLAGLAKQEYGIAAIFSILIGTNFYTPQNIRIRVSRSLLVLIVASVCVFFPLALLAQPIGWKQLFSFLLPVAKSQVLTESGLFDVSLAKTFAEWSKIKVFAATSFIIWSAIIAAHLLCKRWLSSYQPYKVTIEFFVSFALATIGLLGLRINLWSSTYKIFIVVSLLVWVGLITLRSHLKPLWINGVKLLAIATFAGLSLLFVRRLACCDRAVFHPLGDLTWLLPFLVLWFAWKWSKQQHKHHVLLWTLLAFSVLLNARFLFYINFYGLYAVTAILLFFTALYSLAQLHIPIAKYLLICLLIGGIANISEFGQNYYSVRSQRGTVYTKDAELAIAFNEAIATIQSTGFKSVLVIPEGSILNFLTGTSSPSKESIFIPGILPNAEAEREFLARMTTHPPELIVYVDIPFFWLKKGYQTYADYNPLVNHWIAQANQLIYTSSKLVYYEREWHIRIYKVET